MELETINETVKLSKVIGRENFIEMVEGDIVVPDIKPDILSLIKTDGDVYITKKEVQDGKIFLEGSVDVYSIYMSDDETNSLKGLNAVLNFSETIELKGCKPGMFLSAILKLNNIDCKVLNSRKITMKCPIEVDVSVMENSEINIVKDLTNAENVEVKKEKISVNELVGVGKENISVKENVSLGEELPSIGEILKCSIFIVNREYKISYNKVLAKADAKIKIIYVSDDERSSIQSFETVIPVTGFVDLNGVHDKMNVDITYNVEYFFVKPAYQDLKANGIYVETEIEVVAKAYEIKELEVISDLYNPNKELNYGSELLYLEQVGNKKNEVINLTQTLGIPELNNARVLDVKIEPVLTEKKSLKDKIIVEGSAIVDILYYNNSKNILEIKKIELPFKQVVEVNRGCNCFGEKIEIFVSDLEYEQQRDGHLHLKLFLELEIDFIDRVNLNIIKDIVQTENILETKHSIIIYYVQPGDTLWNIAKRYRTTVATIMEANDLKDDNLYIGQQLLIPRRVYKISLNPLI